MFCRHAGLNYDKIRFFSKCIRQILSIHFGHIILILISKIAHYFRRSSFPRWHPYALRRSIAQQWDSSSTSASSDIIHLPTSTSSEHSLTHLKPRPGGVRSLVFNKKGVQNECQILCRPDTPVPAISQSVSSPMVCFRILNLLHVF